MRPGQEEAARILVLEDDDQLRPTLVSLLREEGYLVEEARRGHEAVEKAHLNDFDLVVADIRMEGMDGLTALEEVRSHQPDVRSLVVTGYSSEADSIRAIRAGVGDYLTKPFSLDVFLQAVRRQLARRLEERRKFREEARLGRTLRWSLRSLMASHGRPEKGTLAAGLARRLGLSQAACQTVELATLVHQLKSLPSGPLLLEDDGPELPLEVERVLRFAEERWDGTGPEGLRGEAIPVEARILAVATAARAQGAEFDPAVLQALEDQSEAQSAGPEGRKRRTVLSLARALEEAGNYSDAHSAYGLLTSPESPSREGVEALLGQARLLRQTGRSSAESARLALGMAERVGALQAASTHLEASLLLPPEEALTSLDRAARLFTELALPVGAALVDLRRAHLGGDDGPVEGALGELLQPQNASELSRSADWLAPFVLERAASGAGARALARMVREFPRRIGHLVRNPNLAPAARKAGLLALVEAGAAGKELLQALTADSDAEVRQAARQALEGGSAPPSTTLRIFSMGSFEVFKGEERVGESQWKTAKVKYLMAWLAAEERPLSEELILEEFWPDDPEKGKNNLYWTTSVLRRCLRPADYVQRVQGTFSLNRELPIWHDYTELQGLLARARTALRAGHVPEGSARVLTLARGPFLEGCYLDWAVRTRTHLETELVEVLGAMARAAGDRHQEVLEISRRLLELDPCHQESHLAVMRAYLGLERPEEAVRQYKRAQQSLRSELGIEPGIPLEEARQRALLSLG